MMTKVKNKEKHNAHKASNIIKNNWFLLKIAIKEAPLYTIDELIQGMLSQTVIFIEHVFMIAYIIECIEFQKPFANVFIFVTTVFVSLFIISAWGNYRVARLKPLAMEKINKKIRLSLYEKASSLDLQGYDDPEFYTDFVWAMNDAQTRTEQVIATTSNFLGAICGFFITGGYIIAQDSMSLVLAVIAIVGILFLGIKRNKKQIQMEEELKPIERKRDYINRVLYLSDYSKEIRLNNVKGKLYNDFEESTVNMKGIIEKRSGILAVLNFLQFYIFNDFLFQGVYVLYLMYMTIVKKVFSYGVMVALYNTVRRMVYSLVSISRALPEYQKHSLYIEKMRNFLSYEIKIKNKENPIYFNEQDNDVKDIELRNVSFAYAGQNKNILNNINLKIKKGEKVAIVGYNGAGKTTLVKVLMRLYDVSEGSLCYDSVDVREYDLNGYRNKFSTVFQDYQLFAASLGENITMNQSTLDEDRALNAIKKAGFYDKFSSLELGFDTPLTKEFDEKGVNLSGGESQKVAVSRVLYKDSPIIILDEPSSALDPISEYELNNTILNISNDKTVIFISHRLSTTKMADRIIMLENGSIIEQGSHDELMEHNGKYAVMFNLQAEKYK